MQQWPLLDIRDALKEVEVGLADVLYYTQVLQADTEGHYPPGAAQLLANITAIRELLADVVPSALVAAMAAEQADYEEQEARWESTEY
jgi:hypothetical protein